MTQLKTNSNLLKDFDLSTLDALENQYYRGYRAAGDSKEQALQNIINMCLGRYSILSEGLSLIAQEMEN